MTSVPRHWSISDDYDWIQGKWYCRDRECARENRSRIRMLGVYTDPAQRDVGGNFRRKAWEHAQTHRG